MYLSEATTVVSARSWAQHGGSAGLPEVTRVAAVAWWLRVRSRFGPVSGRLAPASSLGGPGGVREVARPLKGQARESWDVTPTHSICGVNAEAEGQGRSRLRVQTGAKAQASAGRACGRRPHSVSPSVCFCVFHTF